MFNTFKWPLVVTLLASITGYFVGGWAGLYTVLILGILETTLSVDNAVVNAVQLQHMTPVWQKLFITVGVLIAVFGMRLLFPILVVVCTTDLGFFQVVTLALNDHAQYAIDLAAAHNRIAGFGGAFLAMIAADYFFGEERDTYFIPAIEAPLAKLGQMCTVKGVNILNVVVPFIAVSALYFFTNDTAELTACFLGIIAYLAVDILGTMLGSGNAGTTAVKSGIIGFLYLELLDASFSFDGVMGAFTISNDVIIIALGLGIGAMFVRTLTLLVVNNNVLNEYEYLEAGAMYAIASLAITTLIGTVLHIPDIITGTTGLFWIATALFVSHLRSNPTVQG